MIERPEKITIGLRPDSYKRLTQGDKIDQAIGWIEITRTAVQIFIENNFPDGEIEIQIKESPSLEKTDKKWEFYINKGGDNYKP